MVSIATDSLAMVFFGLHGLILYLYQICCSVWPQKRHAHLQIYKTGSGHLQQPSTSS